MLRAVLDSGEVATHEIDAALALYSLNLAGESNNELLHKLTKYLEVVMSALGGGKKKNSVKKIDEG